MLKNEDVVILHPQTIGYENVEAMLIKLQYMLWIIVFFCIKSYLVFE
jgi:hypothetical protein